MSDRVVVESIPAANTLVADIKRWGADLGFARLGVATIDLAGDEAHFRDWLLAGFNGEMEYLSRHGAKRTRPSELVPGTVAHLGYGSVVESIDRRPYIPTTRALFFKVSYLARL